MGSRVGIMKIAAKKTGLSYEEYLSKINQGLKWCTHCRQWKPKEMFGFDTTRGDGLRAPCFACSRVAIRKKRQNLAPSSNLRQNAAYVVRAAIERGNLVKPESLPCFDCSKPAIVYHHHLGYSRSHYLDVIALCKQCHTIRHWQGEK